MVFDVFDHPTRLAVSIQQHDPFHIPESSYGFLLLQIPNNKHIISSQFSKGSKMPS